MTNANKIGLQRFSNNKFEVFVLKNLSNGSKDLLYSYEPCIIEWKSKKLLRESFICLTDQKIFITEYPPKIIQPVCKCKEVQSADMIGEYPNFFVGLLREQCQHVRICFKQVAKAASPGEKGSKSDAKDNRPDDDSGIYSDLSKDAEALSIKSAEDVALLSQSLPASFFRRHRSSFQSDAKNEKNSSLFETDSRPNTSASGFIVTADNDVLSQSLPTSILNKRRSSAIGKRSKVANDYDVIDVFLKDGQSNFLQLLHVCCNDSQLYEWELLRHVSPSGLSQRSRQLFDELRRELLSATAPTELMQLCEELQAAMNGNPSLCRLFWMDSLLIELISEKIMHFIEEQPERQLTARQSKASSFRDLEILYTLIGDVFKHLGLLLSAERLAIIRQNNYHALKTCLQALVHSSTFSSTSGKEKLLTSAMYMFYHVMINIAHAPLVTSKVWHVADIVLMLDTMALSNDFYEDLCQCFVKVFTDKHASQCSVLHTFYLCKNINWIVQHSAILNGVLQRYGVELKYLMNADLSVRYLQSALGKKVIGLLDEIFSCVKCD